MSDPKSATHLSRRLKIELGKTLALFAKLSPEEWHLQVYTEGANWSVHQVFQHLIASERALRTLIGVILEGGQGAPQDFDIDRFNESQVRKIEAQPFPDPLGALSQERENTLAYLASLPDGSLDLQGHHPYFGEISVHQLFKWIYQHGQGHLRDVRRTLQTPTDQAR